MMTRCSENISFAAVEIIRCILYSFSHTHACSIYPNSTGKARSSAKSFPPENSLEVETKKLATAATGTIVLMYVDAIESQTGTPGNLPEHVEARS